MSWGHGWPLAPVWTLCPNLFLEGLGRDASSNNAVQRTGPPNDQSLPCYEAGRLGLHGLKSLRGIISRH